MIYISSSSILLSFVPNVKKKFILRLTLNSDDKSGKLKKKNTYIHIFYFLLLTHNDILIKKHVFTNIEVLTSIKLLG